MKRTILWALLCLLFTGLCWADSSQAKLTTVRHHVRHHHAHKAGKHHVPKRHRRTV